MTWQFRFVAHSEIGLVRKNNQDSGYASTDLLVVADGMGGAAAGDLASAAAIDQIRTNHERPAVPTTTPGSDPVNESGEPDQATDEAAPATDGDSSEATSTDQHALDDLAEGVHLANERLADLIADDRDLDGMGTTVSAVRLTGQQYALVHIGDSRAYLLRDGQLQHLTHDHSWVQSLVDEGRLTSEEANYHPHRSLLLKVLNGQPQHDPDLGLQGAREGDRLLVCSDGLCGFVPDDVIAERLAEPDAATALAALTTDALLAGGSDNITIIVADVVAEPVDLSSVVLGAAEHREIPTVSGRARVDLGDVAPPPQQTDAQGNPIPPAPAPRLSPTEHERYAPRLAPPWHRRWGRPLLVALLALIVLGGAAFGTYSYARTQYFVAPHDNQVAIYRGLNEQVGDWKLHELYQAYDIDIADLPRTYRTQLTGGITADSLDGARATVTELRNAAQLCREVRARRTTTPTPTPSTPAPSLPAGSPSAAPPTSPGNTLSPGATSTVPNPTQSQTPTGDPTLTPFPDEGDC